MSKMDTNFCIGVGTKTVSSTYATNILKYHIQGILYFKHYITGVYITINDSYR
jgi:hypothetical protein